MAKSSSYTKKTIIGVLSKVCQTTVKATVKAISDTQVASSISRMRAWSSIAWVAVAALIVLESGSASIIVANPGDDGGEDEASLEEPIVDLQPTDHIQQQPLRQAASGKKDDSSYHQKFGNDAQDKTNMWYKRSRGFDEDSLTVQEFPVRL